MSDVQDDLKPLQSRNENLIGDDSKPSNVGIIGLPAPADIDSENLDEDDIPDDPFEDDEHDPYFNEEEVMEEIDEAEERLGETEQMRKAA
jgi:hypothetical protein